MNDEILIVFVVDKSGSMGSVVKATIAGFNEFVAEQAALPGDAYLSLVLFDDKVDLRFEAVELALVPAMTLTGINSYQANGGTALYDAVGFSIRSTEVWVADHPSFNGRVIVAVWTDGEERDSRKWKLADLNDLIKAKMDEGWEFAFLGSGEAAWTEGQKLSAVPAASTIQVGSGAVAYAGAYHAFTNSMTASRQYNTPMFTTMQDVVWTPPQNGTSSP